MNLTPIKISRNFTPCDICRIGLGQYKLKRKLNNGNYRWEKVRGEEKIKWEGGKVKIFVDKPGRYGLDTTLVYILPKKVCPYCYKRYIYEGS